MPERVERREQGLSPARSLGRYMVLSQVSQEGRGQAYAAYDPRLDRRITLKLLHAHSDVGGRERFLREAKALARLSHPNVVAVHEVDEVDGRALLAVEYVEGQTLKDWLDGHPVGCSETRTLEALELLVQAGKGLVAAHAEGLVHRDFKPSNIHVGRDGRVRVADFCLAGAVDAEVDVLLGTPAYMAPEQFGDRRIDALSDQFSFCVAAWEMVFGVRPYEGHRADGLLAAFRAGALQGDEGVVLPGRVQEALRKGLAIRPSARHHSVAALLNELQTEIDALRGRAPRRRGWRGWWVIGVLALLGAGAFGTHRWNIARLTRACVVQGDAIDGVWNDGSRDALVSALASTKVGSAIDLGATVTPWIETQAESWREQTRTACMNATVHDSWAPVELDKARWCLEERRLELEALVAELADADELAAQNATAAASSLVAVKTCLDRGWLASMETPPEHESRVALASTRAALLRSRTLQSTGHYDAGLELARTSTHAAESAGWAPMVASASALEASLLNKTGDYAAAQDVGIRAFVEAGSVGSWATAACAATQLAYVVGDQLKRHDEALLWVSLSSMASSHARDPSRLREASRLSHLGLVYSSNGEYDKALQAGRDALAIEEAVYGSQHPTTASSYNNIGLAYDRNGEYGQALHFLRKGLSVDEDLLGDKHPRTATIYNNIGLVYIHTGEYDKALQASLQALTIQEETLTEKHPDIAISNANIGAAYQSKGDYDRALVWFTKSLTVQQEVLGDHPDTASSYNSLGSVHASKGDYDQALAEYRKALAIQVRRLGAHPDTATTYNNIGIVHAHKGEYDKALISYGRCLDIEHQTLGATHPNVARSYNNIGTTLASMGEHDEALKAYFRAFAMVRATRSEKHPIVGASYNNIAGVYETKGDYPHALEYYHRALSIAVRTLGEKHAVVATVNNNIGFVHLQKGDYDEARSFYFRSLAIKEETLGTDHPATARSYNNIGRLYAREGMYEQALQFIGDALAIRRKVLGEQHPDTMASREHIRELCQENKYKPACAVAQNNIPVAMVTE